MRRLTTIAVSLCWGMALLLGPCAFAQQSKAPRAVIAKVMPVYPPLARPLRLEGTVKVSVVVDASGNPKTVQGTGGHPLLLKSAQDAVAKWKWAPAAQQTTESVELRFHPE